MMEHIRQIDWCASQPDVGFVIENELDNCVTERILRNKYRDPLVSSDSESEAPIKINWDEVFKKKKNGDKPQRLYVPGLRPLPPFPKLSALTARQHYQCLKVLCAQNPQVLEAEFLPRPTKSDYRVFEEAQAIYLQEQKEFLDWAKTQWTNHQCIRALRPKPIIETVYEAEFKMRAHGMKGYPKNYDLAAQIPLETNDNTYDLVCGKELISVSLSELPLVYIPELIVKRFTVMRPCATPEPCAKHPCHFQLPSEKTKSVLPVLEVHQELAQFAIDNGVQIIASENSLKCLLELDRAWNIPVTVCETISPDGDKVNVVVLGSEFSLQRESAPRRTYKALRHLLQYAIVPPSEQAKWLRKGSVSPRKGGAPTNNNDMDVSSDDDNDSLVIDDGGATEKDIESTPATPALEMETDPTDNSDKDANKGDDPPAAPAEAPPLKNASQFGVYNCTCKDTIYERPPPRSYRKWQVKNLTTKENYDLIVHCAHKVRGNAGELLVEPIPEYQIEMGGTKQSDDKMNSLALSLKLRRNASLLNVRVDNQSGDVVTFSPVAWEEVSGRLPAAAAALGAALAALAALRPKRYVLRHLPLHGRNALLMAQRPSASPSSSASPSPALALRFEAARADADDAGSVKAPPALEPVLLPLHKFRKILPLAFTPHPSQVAKEPKKPVTRQKTPPQALKWPKRKKKAKGKN